MAFVKLSHAIRSTAYQHNSLFRLLRDLNDAVQFHSFYAMNNLQLEFDLENNY